MDMDIAIIGGGVIGLAIASELSEDGKSVYVLEKNRQFGMETSSRNSEVGHAALLYYPQGSLMARFCREGRDKLEALINQGIINGKKVGKYIVATDDSQKAYLEEKIEVGKANGAEGLEIITGDELKKREPNVEAVAALWSPNTLIIDSHGLMEYLIRVAKSKGGDIVYGTELLGIDQVSGGYKLTVRESNGEVAHYTTRRLINCAGLKADEVAQMAGIDIDEAGYRQHYCKGEYFRINGHAGMINSLIYPVPEKAGLGVHATLELDKMAPKNGVLGGIKLGPNAFYVDRDTADYRVDPDHQEGFFKSVTKFLTEKFIKDSGFKLEDLSPDQAGIRPKLQGPDDDFRDVVVNEETDKGFPGLTTIVGAESPMLTGALAIGPYVAKLEPSRMTVHSP